MGKRKVVIKVVCPGCDGNKKVNLNGKPDQDCPTCDGTGERETTVEVEE